MAQSSKHFVLVGPAYPYRGGIAHFGEMVTDGLRQEGHRVEEITFRRQYPRLLFPGKTQYADGTPPEGPRAERIIDSVNPVSWWRAADRVAEGQPDAVLFQHWMPFFAPAFGTIARLVRRRGIRPLAVVHNALPHERRPGDRLLNRYFFSACEGFVVMSSAVRIDLHMLGARGPVRRVPHPVYARFGEGPSKQEARRELGLPLDVPLLLFFGFVRPYKGLRTLLRAMPRVTEALPEAQLVVAGAFYEDEAPYHALIREQKLQQRVRLDAGYVDDEDVPRYFAAADVVVQPYTHATQSGVAQIAFHFERPVITTSVGGLPENVPDGEAGLVVPPEHPEALARAIVRFFEDDLAAQFADGVRRQKARHGVDALVRAVAELAE